MKKKLYFGCALAGLPAEHRSAMITIREGLKDHFEVLEFCPAGTDPREIYEHDINNCVASADLMVAMCDKPSLGLGYEMSTMVEKHHKPLLILAHNDSQVSSLILGISNSKCEFRRYSDTSEILSLILDFEKRYFLISQSL